MRILKVAAALAFVGAALAGCSSTSSPSAVAFGPSGSKFIADFPSTPKQQSNTSGLLQNFPKGAKAYGFWVSPESDIFATSASIPTPETYFVIEGVLASKSAATAFVAQLKEAPEFKAVKMSGFPGYEFIGSENSSINQGTKLTDPKAIEATFIVSKNATLYEVFAITSTRSKAVAFLDSFKTASG